MDPPKINLTALINPQPKQQTALETLFNPLCKYFFYGGAGGGGKSYFLRWAALALVLYYTTKYGIRGVEVGLFSEDYPTLRDRQIGKIKREFPPWLGNLKQSQEDGYVYQLAPQYGGGKIKLRNLDDPSKYASSEFAAIGVEELTKNKKETFDDLRFRMRWPGVKDVKFFAASNPGQVGHGWVKAHWITADTDDPEQARFFYVPARVTDNKYIDVDYRRQLDSLPEPKRSALRDGSWDVFAGQYFSEFSKNKHVVPGFIPNRDSFSMFVGGLDWGRAKPFSCHITGIQERKHGDITFYRAWTFLECYGTDKSPAEWGEEIIQKLAFYELTLDDINFIECDTQIFVKQNDNSKAIYDQFVDVDERFRGVLRPASKDRIGGWENMHNWLKKAPDGNPYWVMTEDCRNLIRTLPELVHDETVVEDVDSDGEDHAGDDQRYQFKALKWIDASVGGVGRSKNENRILPTAITQDGRQVSVDLDKFADAWWNDIGRYRQN